jgi:putative transferase (TIGR04331 family)
MLIPLKIFNKNYIYNPVKFYKKLDDNLKSYYNYRPLPSVVNQKNNKKIINKMKKVSNVEINSSVEKTLNEARVIILDSFSTTFYECLYKGIPIIIIADIDNFNFKESYINILLKLMNKKMIFNSPEKAAIFLNKNYDNLIDWWNNLYNSNTMKKLKDYLYTEDSNFCKKITFELKKI